MFGVVPRVLWEKTNPPDERNRIHLALATLLVRAHGKNILIDTGIGNKGDEKFCDIYAVDRHPPIEESLAKIGLAPRDIDLVVNTHFHFDHAHGNQVFPEDVEIIGHEFTREKLVTGASKNGRSWDLFVGGLPGRITEMEAQLKAAQDGSDQTKAAELRKSIEVSKQHQIATGAIEVTPPTTTLSERMTIFRGGREIRLLYFGRGHTGGDVVVYLPREKIVATGDLLTAGLSYMGDGYLEEWANTLEELKSLDFEVVLPGHGEAFREREKIDYFQAYLRDLSQKIAKMHADGVSAADAAARIDMTSHAAHFPAITGPGVHPHAVERAYALLEGKEQ
jgi:glyoxylase-like metal-dependent hydrolase (beta-lactamase superfamily II)